MKRFLATLLSLALLLHALPASAQGTDVKVTGGRVSGALSDGTLSFKGIPFAAPPVGDLRWKAPQPVKSWTGVKQATAFGASCMQAQALSQAAAAPPGFSEDCLYLNVWTPAKRGSGRLPVMVWIYGGSFTAGQTSTPTYDGTRLAEKGVIIVSVAYRVGAFGFLAHPELSRESGKGSGNFGLQDQIAGLKWVKDNIAKFGGDPNNVTLFGESAGGISVSMLAASPPARGLFRRIISESGGHFGSPRTANEGGLLTPPLTVAEATGKGFLERAGARDIAAARLLPADKLQATQSQFWPVFDGDVLPGDQYKLYQARKFNDTPVLIGTNSNEGSIFVPGNTAPAAFENQIRAGYGPQADNILAAYPHATGEEATQSARDIFRDTIFAWPTWAWAELQAKHGKGKVYYYYFDRRTPQSPAGSSHGSEIPFVFKTLASAGGQAAADLALSDLMSSYWVNFARTGDPNGPGLPPWPTYSAAAQTAMVFDARPSARPAPNLTQLKALDGYYAWRREPAGAGK